MTLNDDGQLGVRIVEDGLVRFVPVRMLRDTTNGVWLAGSAGGGRRHHRGAGIRDRRGRGAGHLRGADPMTGVIDWAASGRGWSSPS
jgi:hypothetical protein